MESNKPDPQNRIDNWVVSKDGVTFFELEPEYDEQSQTDRGLEAAKAKGYRPYIDVTKGGEVYTIEANPEEMKQAFAKGYFLTGAPHLAENRTVGDKVMSAAIGAAQGIGMEMMDEATGAYETARDAVKGDIGVSEIPEHYKQKRNQARERLDMMAERDPYAFHGGNIAGGIGSAFIPGMNAGRGAGLAKTAAANAGFGAVSSYGAEDSDDIGDQLKSAGLGAGFGAGLTVAPDAIKYAKNEGLLNRGMGKVISQVDPKVSNRYRQRMSEIDNAQELPQLADEMMDTLDGFIDRSTGQSSVGYKILERQGGEVPTAQMAAKFRELAENPMKAGAPATPEAMALSEKLAKMADMIEQEGPSIPLTRAKDLIRQVDGSIRRIGRTMEMGKKSPEFTSMTAGRKGMDRVLKDASPAYGAHMDGLSGDMSRMEEILDAIKGNPKKADNLVKRMLTGRHASKHRDRAAIERMDEVMGSDLMNKIDDTYADRQFKKSTTAGSRKAVFGAAMGAALGPEGWGGMLTGLAAGAGTGLGLDNYGGTIFRQILKFDEKAARVVAPVVQAYKRAGPRAANVAHRVMYDNEPAYRALIDNYAAQIEQMMESQEDERVSTGTQGASR